MKRIKNIKNNLFFSICILSLGIIFEYLINIFIMKKAPLSEYGIYNLIITYGNIFGVVLGFGFPEIIKKELININLEIKKLIFNLLIRSLGIITIIFIILIFMNLNNNILLFGVITIAITNICKNMLYAIYISTKEILKYYILDKIILKILTAIIFLIFLINKTKLEVILVYKLLFELFIILILLKKFLKFEYIKVKVEYLKYGGYLMLHQITEISIISMDKILINRIINTEAVGIYSFCYMVSNLLLFPITVIQNKFYPSFSKAVREKNKFELKKLYTVTREIGVYLTIPLIFIYINYSEVIFSIISKNMAAYNKLLVYLAIAMYINVFSGLNGTIINLSSYYRIQFYLKIIFILITILGNIYFLKKYGLNGAAISSSICLIIYNFFKGIVVYLKEKIHPFSRNFFKELLIILVLILLNFIFKKLVTINIFSLTLLLILQYCIVLAIVGKRILKYLFFT